MGGNSLWLLKTEPDHYSYADLERDRATVWDGVSNNAALIHIRTMRPGDLALIYHTGDERQAVGLAHVERGPYPDPTDPAGKRVWVDLRAAEPLAKPVSLATLKASPAFAESPLLRMSRLSVLPLTQAQFDEILKLGG